MNIQAIRGRHGTGGGERCVHCWWPLCLQSHRSPRSGPPSVAAVMPRLPGLGVGLSASARSPRVSLSERHIPAGPASFCFLWESPGRPARPAPSGSSGAATVSQPAGSVSLATLVAMRRACGPRVLWFWLPLTSGMSPGAPKAGTPRFQGSWVGCHSWGQ